MPPIMEDQEGNIRIVPLGFRRLELKTFVRNYDDARYQLLAVAERMRNYTAYVVGLRLPMSFDMIGKKRDNGQWLPFPAVFDGTTRLPISDGGIGDTMIFTTRLGSHLGVRPPDEALKSPENLAKWTIEFDGRLLQTQRLVERIKNGTPLDVAISALGASIWAEEAKDKVLSCWRAIEAITKNDFPNGLVKAPMLYETIRRRTKKPPELKQLRGLRLLRNLSAHGEPLETQAKDMHVAADEIYAIAYEVTKSALKDAATYKRKSI